jgi:hypothetical protein
MADAMVAPQPGTGNSPAGNQSNQQEPRLTPFALLKGILVRPRATFTRLRSAKRGYGWLALLLAVVAISLLSYATIHAETAAPQGFALPSGTYAPRQGGFTPRTTTTPTAGTNNAQTGTQAAGTSQSSATGTYVVPILSSIGGVALGYLFCSFVVFSMSIIFGGKATYAQVFRMVVWALLPLAIGNLIHVVASLMTGGVPVPGLSAALTSQESQDLSMIQVLLGHIDVYLVWSMALLGVGTVATSRLSNRKSAAVVLIYLALAAGVIVGLTAASGALSELFGGQFNLNILTRGTRLR